VNREAGRLNGRMAAALAATLVFGFAAAAAAQAAPPDRRIALFQTAGFPATDVPAVPPAVLTEALAGLPADTFADPAELAAGLNAGGHAVLLLPYGSAFPLEAWDAIRAFLDAGGGLVVLGGRTFDPAAEAAQRLIVRRLSERPPGLLALIREALAKPKQAKPEGNYIPLAPKARQ